MPTLRKETRNGIYEHTCNTYSSEEIPEYWLQNDRYINDAKLMDKGCIVVDCTEQQAKEIAAYFVNNLFAIPTCTYYDGHKLSLCFIYAGGGMASLVDKTKQYLAEYFTIL